MHPGLPHKRVSGLGGASCKMIRIAGPVLGWLPPYQVDHLVYSDARSIQGTSKFQHKEDLNLQWRRRAVKLIQLMAGETKGSSSNINEVDAGSHLASKSIVESINLRLLYVGEEVEVMINESLMPWIFKAMALDARSKCMLTPLRS
jgi:hypothetical protein